MAAEPLLAAGYAIAMIAAAGVLEWLSRLTHNRSREYRTGGFEYDKHHDYWVCQQGEQLWPAEFDREKRLVRYRAKSSACRTCAIKHLCTDSDQGREVTRPVDPWPHSEAGRFHRGIAVMVASLAVFVLVVEMIRNHGILELAVLVPLLGAAGYAVWWLARDLLQTPSGFPEIMPAHGNRLRPGTGEEGHMSDRGDLGFDDRVRAEEPGVPRFGRERVIRWKSGQAVNGSKADAPEEFPEYGQGATITAE
ncbi:MAG: hypothetical protein M9938_04955 [Solirubrobacterales bacterium]|nr:hypothetical protein [Solirubrobacterales bacterium]